MKNIITPLLKIYFSVLRPKAVFVFGENSKITANMISGVLDSYFKAWRRAFIFEFDIESREEIDFLINNSSLPILVLTDLKKENIKDIKKAIKFFNGRGKIIFNGDGSAASILQEEDDLRGLAFGLKQAADFQASDIKENGEINFKLNREGSSVPVWLKSNAGRFSVYAALAAFAAGSAFGLNLVEISQALKNKN